MWLVRCEEAHALLSRTPPVNEPPLMQCRAGQNTTHGSGSGHLKSNPVWDDILPTFRKYTFYTSVQCSATLSALCFSTFHNTFFWSTPLSLVFPQKAGTKINAQGRIPVWLIFSYVSLVITIWSVIPYFTRYVFQFKGNNMNNAD
jgi:hypothetical protein